MYCIARYTLSGLDDRCRLLGTGWLQTHTRSFATCSSVILLVAFSMTSAQGTSFNNNNDDTACHVLSDLVEAGNRRALCVMCCIAIYTLSSLAAVASFLTLAGFAHLWLSHLN